MATSYPDRTNARGIWTLSEITKKYAKTIHSLLEIDFSTKGFKKGRGLAEQTYTPTVWPADNDEMLLNFGKNSRKK